MKLFLTAIRLLVLLCLCFQVSAQDEENPVLKKRISVHLENQPLSEVIDEISKQAGIDFSYDPSILNGDYSVSVDYDQKEAGWILQELLGANYQFQVLSGQLIITLKERKDQPSEIWPDAPSPDILTVAGEVTDASGHDVIPYASVSVLDEPFGTIANRDGRFEIKIPEKYQGKNLVFSCMGYAQKQVKPDSLAGKTAVIALEPIDIRLGEIKVTAASAESLLEKFIGHISDNYPLESRLMTSFYREVLMQDKSYVNVSEAVINILKAPYDNPSRDDRISFLKGRKSRDVKPFKWVDFKMQGGPYYITKLDVVKTMESFLDPEYRNLYKYEMGYLIDYFDRPTYVILFHPDGKIDFPCYEGKLYIDQETFALVHAEFSLGKEGMKYARRSLIRKKPKGFNVKPLDLDYSVTYKPYEGRWYLNTAQASLRFRVKSRGDRINSVFKSVSDLLVTSHEHTDLKRFQKDETFLPTDIFTEMIIDYDNEFWGNFNIIQPNEDLRNALKKINATTQVLKGGHSVFATDN